MSLDVPNLRVRSIDLSIEEWNCQVAKCLASNLIAELERLEREITVAYRNGYRWLKNIQPIQLKDTVDESLPLRHKGVYLITGGTGGIGLSVARYLARTVRARLILTARTPLPERRSMGRIDRDSWCRARPERTTA